MFIFIQ